jgi:hypothetical protein
MGTFWQQHEARMARQQAQFGTVLGKNTITDLRNLVTNKDASVKIVKDAWDAFQPTWQASNPTAANQWGIAWSAAFFPGYMAARTNVQTLFDQTRAVPESVSTTGVDDAWNGIIKALSPGGAANLSDLVARLNAALTAAGKPQMDFSGVSQTTGTDVDSAVLTNRPIEQAARAGHAVVTAPQTVADATASAREAAERAARALADTLKQQEEDLKHGLYIAGGLAALFGIGIAVAAYKSNTPENREAAIKAAKLLL